MTILETANNSSLYIEIADRPHIVQPHQPGEGGVPAAGMQDIFDKLKDVGSSVGETCAVIFGSAIQKIGQAKPTELSLEFSISLGGEAGVPFVTKGHAEGSFKVTATWKMLPVNSSASDSNTPPAPSSQN
jgi:hypothetical protein